MEDREPFKSIKVSYTLCDELADRVNTVILVQMNIIVSYIYAGMFLGPAVR